MLLRSIASHVQGQNWLAVLIDFLIVVVGVFMGLQVQDWYETRKERIAEEGILSRLLQDTQSLLQLHDEELESLGERAARLKLASHVLFSTEPVRELSYPECASIASSHVYRRPADELPVLDEMLNAGRFDLLQDQGIKAQLRDYLIRRERARAYHREIVNELFRLHSRFPDLIVASRVPEDEWPKWGGMAGEGFRWNVDCDAEKMRANQAFLNEYVDNLSRLTSLTEFVEQKREILARLEAALESR